MKYDGLTLDCVGVVDSLDPMQLSQIHHPPSLTRLARVGTVISDRKYFNISIQKYILQYFTYISTYT